MDRHEVVVIGLGAVGGATTLALARRGVSVLGLDQFTPPHTRGSSHGDTRITRLAVGEGPAYAPLVRRSHELWGELEAETGRTLMVQCGGLVMGVPGASGQHHVDDFTARTKEVAVRCGVAFEELTAAQVRERFGVFTLSEETACFEPTAGYLRAEECVTAQIEAARRHGADISLGEEVLAFSADGAGVVVATTHGEHHADRLVIAAGPWVGLLARDLAPLVQVHRQVQYWFEIRQHYERFRDLPVFIWMYGTVPGQFLYGFPALDGPGGGVKVASEDFTQSTDPRFARRDVDEDEVHQIFEGTVRHLFADLGPRAVRTRACLYTVTRDFGFVIDRLGTDRVVVASPCSGHGFKHAPAVGEATAQLVLGQQTSIDVGPFAIDRLRGELAVDADEP